MDRRYSKRHSDGPLPTTRQLCQILPGILEEIGRLYYSRPDLVLAAWPEVVGSRLATMTRAVSFLDGVLTVKVSNAPLHSLLAGYEKPRLIKNLRDKFPNMVIKTIIFRR
jgi:hypothetical protein